MTNFSILWDTKVKAIAIKCVNNDLVELMMTPEGNITDDIEAKFKELSSKYIDPLAQHYISQMISGVEHGLADDRDCVATISVSQVYNTLSSESYWTNVWKNNNLDTEEAKNLKELAENLKIILDESR
jgi:hypothetical protein